MLSALAATAAPVRDAAALQPTADPTINLANHTIWQPHAARLDRANPVALCLAGQLRMLRHSFVRRSLRLAVLEPIAPAVFMHVTREDGGIHASASMSESEIQSVLDELRPASLSLQDDASLACRACAANSQRSSPPTSAAVGCATCDTLTLRWADCADDIERFEHESTLRFQWVIRARPDLVYSCRLPPLRSWPTYVGSRGFALLNQDQLAIVSRPAAGALLRLRDRIGNASHGACVDKYANRIDHDVCIDSLLKEQNAEWCEVRLTTIVRAEQLGMGVSLFRRLCEAHPRAVARLRRQYRMAADIMGVSSALVYGGQLRCGSAAVARRLKRASRGP